MGLVTWTLDESALVHKVDGSKRQVNEVTIRQRLVVFHIVISEQVCEYGFSSRKVGVGKAKKSFKRTLSMVGIGTLPLLWCEEGRERLLLVVEAGAADATSCLAEALKVIDTVDSEDVKLGAGPLGIC